MSQPAVLEVLALRCEKAGSSSYALECEIAKALGQYATPPLNYTVSVDMALTLVPDGWTWQVSNRAPKPNSGRAYIHNSELIFSGVGTRLNPKHESSEVVARTPALALCAAALRARAALSRKDQPHDR